MRHPHTPVSRRPFGRGHALGLGAVATVAPTVAFGPAHAGDRRVWCRAAPLFAVGATVIDVTIGSQFEMFATATGPVKVKLATPAGVAATLLASDLGFGRDYEVSYATDEALKGGASDPEVRVEVLAPSAADLPVSVCFTRVGASGEVELRSGEAQGRSNCWVTTR